MVLEQEIIIVPGQAILINRTSTPLYKENFLLLDYLVIIPCYAGDLLLSLFSIDQGGSIISHRYKDEYAFH